MLAPTVSKMVSEVTVLRSRYQELLQGREALRNETSKAQDDMEEDGEARSISPIKTRSVQKQESENYFRQNSQVVLNFIVKPKVQIQNLKSPSNLFLFPF